MRSALDGVDLLWTHSIGSLGGKALKVATERSIPTISMIHSIEWEIYSQNLPIGKDLFRTIWRRECRRRYQNAATILTPSEATASVLRAEGFEPPIIVTPLGVDTDRFKPLNHAERRERRRSLGISDDTFVFGYLGRFGAEKNLELLIRAFNELNHPQSHLLMVGGKSEALEALNQHPNTTFRGSTTTPEHFYPLMDAYVLPSLSESAPLAILEAMACGVIPLSTPVGNVPSYLNNTIGFLFSPIRRATSSQQCSPSSTRRTSKRRAVSAPGTSSFKNLIGRQALSALLKLYTRRCLSPQRKRAPSSGHRGFVQPRSKSCPQTPVVDVTQTLQCTEHEPAREAQA